MAMTEFGIDTPRREAMFLAHLGHESLDFKALEENLNYKNYQTLMATFRFAFRTPEEAVKYIKLGKEAIGNKAYAFRLGNGHECTGDGFKYRGRGPIQLTGKRNYEEFGIALGVDLLSFPDRAKEPDTGSRIAARFWKTRNCNKFADADNIYGSTLAINGGTNGLKDRTARYNKIKSIMGIA